MNDAEYSQGLFRWRGFMENIKQAVLEAILCLSLGNDDKSTVTEICYQIRPFYRILNDVRCVFFYINE